MIVTFLCDPNPDIFQCCKLFWIAFLKNIFVQ
uniref:Uncharacterized protein n=1 Tax=Arundo donax TaxID=35708 RepID=A0A0A9EAT7_ARUDO